MITEKKLELLHQHLIKIPHRLIRKALDPIRSIQKRPNIS